ncbi:MAG: NAD(P)-dependent oxidoreductase [Phycisphaeraceae bacterium]|nr:NAD(P)-dependent oxidoreductase [Phycisphaeraceae bacterium]
MSTSTTYLENLKNRVYFATDKEVPRDFLDRMFAEGERVWQDTLAPKGLEDRKVLIVGGGGYIGVPLTTHLLARGYSVRCLDLLLYQNRDVVHPFLGAKGYEFMFGDMADKDTVTKALDGVSDVIVLAGLVGDPITKKYPQESAAINDAGVLNVIEQCNGKGLNKVVFVSTCSNYGEIPVDTTADESFELKPLSLYAKSKVAAETAVLDGKGQVDYTGTVLRFSTAFGLSGRMRFDLTVSEFTRDLYVNKKLDVYDADTWRPYCHVQDFACGLTRVLEAPAEDVAFDAFNAGGDVNNYTKAMMVEAIVKHIPDGEITYVEGGFDRRNYKVDFSRIRNRLHFTPKYTVDDGIRELIAALKQGFFHDYEQRRDYYRNNDIEYSKT